MKWFNTCNTIEEIKKRYRELAQKFHPDHGGTNADMVSINLEYEKAFEQAKKGMTTEKAAGYDVNDGYRQTIEQLLNLEGLIIELCGKWLWISGNTRQHKDTLKAIGCYWASKKGMWYWRPAEEKVGPRRKSMDMDWIRNNHGSIMIEGERKDKKQIA